MSNRLFQGVIHQMRDAIDRTIMPAMAIAINFFIVLSS